MAAISILEATSMAEATPKESISTLEPKPVIVKEVWAENLEFELWQIREIIGFYPVVTIDTEFPGTIYKRSSDKNLNNNPPYNYDLMKANVDDLKIIQLGLTLSDFDGNLPSFGSSFSYIWQFNFCDFDIDEDPHDPDSIQLLRHQGIDFEKNKEKGIPSSYFGRLFLRFGILSKVPLTWLTFHGGYDFAYLIKILSGEELPCDLVSFVDQLWYYFGAQVYDLKTVMSRYNFYGGLENLAKKLRVKRVAGRSHQAGSDSLLTMQTFMELKQQCFADEFELTMEKGKWTGFEWELYGLKVVVLLDCHGQVYTICDSDWFDLVLCGGRDWKELNLVDSHGQIVYILGY
ncbi:hypothetical protein HS088_TW10G00804 [Tripterygium wilfordii]|uniref:poly(A)-specific ribonuclease n=1 Tax=Tripterygium wilfordii TaxID=458696 RepID=A0A7J7D661_TRIWF|nr:probable CCR4-associated factor 1 homolog 11 [Tripterygium wilfordii]KAF5741798.1 hypothetical protein HS088_TW10G00804 [Tripterygium wilfordii]